MAISKESIDDIRSRADIVTEIGSRIELKKAGGNYVGLCPFHGEKSPSFSVSAPKQFFHCFGCGKSGDVIQFLMEHDGMQFHEAVKDLGERLGVKVQEDQDEKSIRHSQEQRKVSATLEDVCEKAAAFYQSELTYSPEATAYVENRGISKEVMRTYGMGFAANSRKPLARLFPDYTESALLASAGLVADDAEGARDRFDRFRDRLIFPIRDARGRCIGFGGRVINANAPRAPKYLNSPETPIFLKNRVLYGLHEARASILREKVAFVSEGYMDVVAMAQNGIPNAVAAMGTALTEEHARLLLRFTDRVVFIFDGDAPGIAAAWKSLKVVLPMLEAKHSFSFLTLPDSQDPDEYLREHGKDAFLALTKTAPTLSQYLLRRLLVDYGQEGALSTVEAKTQFSVAAETLCALIPQVNPLKDLLLQEVDALVGRMPRASNLHTQTVGTRTAGGSAAERLRMKTTTTAFQGQGQEARPWVSKEEWLKNKEAGQANSLGYAGYGSFKSTQPIPQALTHDKKSLWTRLTEAVVMAPVTALAVAPTITALLDPENTEEQLLAEILAQCGSMAPRADRYFPDQLQAASDLLNSAQELIAKQRVHEVSAELKKMRDDGELSEDSYVSEMLKLPG